MNWNKITLSQFQDIWRLSKDKELDEIERVGRTIGIVYDMTEEQIDNMPLWKFNELAKSCNFLLDGDIPGKPVKSFWVGRKKYAINYNPKDLKHRQYIEILHFADATMENMHYIMASLVNRVRFGFKLKNTAKDHAKLSEEMLEAPFLAIYHSCIFFCKLYKNSIEAIRPYLIDEMLSKGMTKEKAETVITYSISAMDGFITQRKWPILKV